MTGGPISIEAAANEALLLVEGNGMSPGAAVDKVLSENELASDDVKTVARRAVLAKLDKERQRRRQMKQAS